MLLSVLVPTAGLAVARATKARLLLLSIPTVSAVFWEVQLTCLLPNVPLIQHRWELRSIKTTFIIKTHKAWSVADTESGLTTPFLRTNHREHRVRREENKRKSKLKGVIYADLVWDGFLASATTDVTILRLNQQAFLIFYSAPSCYYTRSAALPCINCLYRKLASGNSEFLQRVLDGS